MGKTNKINLERIISNYFDTLFFHQWEYYSKKFSERHLPTVRLIFLSGWIVTPHDLRRCKKHILHLLHLNTYQLQTHFVNA